MILAHALLKIDIREKLPRPLVGSPHRSPRRMPSSRESCPPPKRHRVLQQPANANPAKKIPHIAAHSPRDSSKTNRIACPSLSRAIGSLFDPDDREDDPCRPSGTSD